MAAALGYRTDGTAARLCFHLQQPSYNTDRLIAVLEQLASFYAGQRVVLIWDGLSAHWSTRMRAWLDSQRDWLCAERLPAYAPSSTRSKPVGQPQGPGAGESAHHHPGRGRRRHHPGHPTSLRQRFVGRRVPRPHRPIPGPMNPSTQPTKLNRSDGGRRSRHGAGRTPQAGAAAQAASGSRSWCHRRGRMAGAWRPARGRKPGQRRAAQRTAPMAPRSAGPGPGLAKSPPRQPSEQMFGFESGTLLTATGWIARCRPACCGRTTRPGDSDCGPEGLPQRSARSQFGTTPIPPAVCDGLRAHAPHTGGASTRRTR
jgi:hypothetical protein